MEEALVVAYAFLFVFTSCIMLLYLKRVRKGSEEYTKAKRLLDDIIISFNKELQQQAKRIRDIAHTDETLSAQHQEEIEKMNLEMASVKAMLDKILKTRESLVRDYDALRRDVEGLMSWRTEIAEELSKLVWYGRVERADDTRIESAIPIGREKALAPLTDTEIRILKMLASGGEKTAPEIRKEIRLTREHTARLMKKLYEQGYVERRTERMPYVYRVKKEMVDLLKSKGSGG